MARRRKHRKAITKYRTRTVTKYRTRSHRRHRRRHHRRGGSGMNLMHLGIAAVGLSYLAGAASPVSTVKDQLAKVPGTATFGPVATAGLICLGIDRLVKRNKWLRAAGVVGVVAAATKLGDQGPGFKWVGDEFEGDVEGDDFVGDDE